MISKLLVANRGEIALRILRSASEIGISSVAIASEDDRNSIHVKRADRFEPLRGRGPAAYLDAEQILRIARDSGCDAIHPGYGFLSEDAGFAEACVRTGILFVGPTAQQLHLLGNKAEARALATRCGVPVLAGSADAVSLEQAHAFLRKVGPPIMIKALAGGGGRGIRQVAAADELGAAFERCKSEALRSFGDDRVYVEQVLPHARHIEVQVVGDGTGAVRQLGDRDCTVQRRHQKLIEVTPSPSISAALRRTLFDAATRLAGEIKLLNLATIEFLVDATGADGRFYFLEANGRLQVEHTVTEEILGIDLVGIQLRLAAGVALAECGLTDASPRSGFALQVRVNMERLLPDGTPVMDGGTITAFEPPTGPGVRVDTCGYRGYATNRAFDSLLAKVIVHSGDLNAALAKARRALTEFVIEGVPNNVGFLEALLEHPMLQSAQFTTRFVDEHLDELLAASAQAPPATSQSPAMPEGVTAVVSPTAGSVVRIEVTAGQKIATGTAIAVIEAMKMEHIVLAPAGGRVLQIGATMGTTIGAGEIIATIAMEEQSESSQAATAAPDLDRLSPSLAELLQRQAAVLDAQRPEAVARRHDRGARTARENVDALCDPGTFIEYGSLVIAAQRRRRSVEELIRRTPGDGVVVGFGSINGAVFTRDAAHSLVVAFDETVLAGTMGEMAREKLKHALNVAKHANTPVVLFAEGGGGRAGDTDFKVGVTGWTMDVATYYEFGQLNGQVPLVGVATGRCFAANAGILACCDVIIATRNANIGVGGPSMIEAGRLGTYVPEDIGPMDVQTANGVVDLLVADEPEAAAAARRYLGYFQGRLPAWEAPDQRALRFVVPENRLRAYDMRQALILLSDTGSVLELRREFGPAMITALIRVEGRPLGVIANSPLHLGGAIDSDAADKASRFMQLCETFGLPILMLCDTPGVMVGPAAEKSATVRKMGRMFVIGANLTVPFFTIVLRKAYGIGAELMAGGWFKAPRFVVSWPTGEFGGMNIEGNVKLAHAADLSSIEDPKERQARFDQLVAEMHSTGRALAVATHYEIDNVIDPAESRKWISMALATAPIVRGPRLGNKISFVSPW